MSPEWEGEARGPVKPSFKLYRLANTEQSGEAFNFQKQTGSLEGEGLILFGRIWGNILEKVQLTEDFQEKTLFWKV